MEITREEDESVSDGVTRHGNRNDECHERRCVADGAGGRSDTDLQ